MSLRDIEYQEDYRSGYDDIVNDFLRPSLARAAGILARSWIFFQQRA